MPSPLHNEPVKSLDALDLGIYAAVNSIMGVRLTLGTIMCEVFLLLCGLNRRDIIARNVPACDGLTSVLRGLSQYSRRPHQSRLIAEECPGTWILLKINLIDIWRVDHPPGPQAPGGVAFWRSNSILSHEGVLLCMARPQELYELCRSVTTGGTFTSHGFRPSHPNSIRRYER